MEIDYDISDESNMFLTLRRSKCWCMILLIAHFGTVYAVFIRLAIIAHCATIFVDAGGWSRGLDFVLTGSPPSIDAQP